MLFVATGRIMSLQSLCTEKLTQSGQQNGSNAHRAAVLGHEGQEQYYNT